MFADVADSNALHCSSTDFVFFAVIGCFGFHEFRFFIFVGGFRRIKSKSQKSKLNNCFDRCDCCCWHEWQTQSIKRWFIRHRWIDSSTRLDSFFDFAILSICCCFMLIVYVFVFVASRSNDSWNLYEIRCRRVEQRERKARTESIGSS